MEQESMTRQEAFNKVYTHLLTQNSKSTNGGGTCMYRGENGCSCAVGCLITDEEYRPWMDGLEAIPEGYNAGMKLVNTNAASLNGNGLLPARLVPHLDLLCDLQAIHDMRDVLAWKFHLGSYAKHRGLTVPDMACANACPVSG